MKKGQILEGIVERVDFPNKGIVRAVEENGEEAFCTDGQREDCWT